MKNTFRILFYPKNTKVNDKGESPIYCRITIKGERAEIPTHYYVAKVLWDEFQHCNNPRKKELVTLRETLDAFRTKVHKDYYELLNTAGYVSAQKLKLKVTGQSEKYKQLIEVAKYFYEIKMAMVDKSIESVTANKYLTTTNYLQEFIEKKYGKTDIALSELKYNFLTEFQVFLLTHKKNQNNSMVNHIKRFKSIITFALQNGYISSNPFTDFKLKREKREKIHLEMEELEAIENREFDIQRLQFIKDILIFSCYTGLSFSDLQKLKRENITAGIDNWKWIIKSRKKTNIISEIPLLPVPEAILEKYKDNPLVNKQCGLLPKISNQKYNSYLKEIADCCGIKKNLTSHVGRHTFATTICADNGVPIDTTSKMLGHTKLETTQIYYKTKRKRISRDMARLAKRLTKMKNNVKRK